MGNVKKKPAAAKRVAKRPEAKIAKKRPSPKPAAPVAHFHVRTLDPKQQCGPGTTVQQLYRISEQNADGSVRPHLVFFDRHGWYCLHGRTCAAVPHAQKFGKATRSAQSRRPTRSGRTRA